MWQSAAVLEVVHAFVGLVRSPWPVTAVQVHPARRLLQSSDWLAAYALVTPLPRLRRLARAWECCGACCGSCPKCARSSCGWAAPSRCPGVEALSQRWTLLSSWWPGPLVRSSATRSTSARRVAFAAVALGKSLRTGQPALTRATPGVRLRSRPGALVPVQRIFGVVPRGCVAALLGVACPR